MVFANGDAEFNEFGDVPCLVAGSVGIIDRDWGSSCSSREIVLFDECLVDSTAGASTIY